MFDEIVPIPVGALPAGPVDHGQRPARPGVEPDTRQNRQPFYYTTDDAWRSIVLPYQRRHDTGRLGAPIADHIAPTGAGYVAVRGAGIGRPSRLASVPIYQYGPDGGLVRMSRSAQNAPNQWTTLAATANAQLFTHAEPVRWPTT